MLEIIGQEEKSMETLKTIFTRKSIRQFTEQKVSKEDIDIILRAGMSAPSCVNARDWAFVVVTDKEMLTKMADANGRPAEPLRGAAFAVLVCGDLERAFQPAVDYWIIDASIAAENMILAAQDMGIGSVWLGTYPQMERVEKQKKLFGLPDSVVPHSILAFGYPLETMEEERDLFEADRVHYEKW
jgi:nitroreductase